MIRPRYIATITRTDLLYKRDTSVRYSRELTTMKRPEWGMNSTCNINTLIYRLCLILGPKVIISVFGFKAKLVSATTLVREIFLDLLTLVDKVNPTKDFFAAQSWEFI